MARFRHDDYEHSKMILLRFTDQIQLGTFDYTLNYVVDSEPGLTAVFEFRRIILNIFLQNGRVTQKKMALTSAFPH